MDIYKQHENKFKKEIKEMLEFLIDVSDTNENFNQLIKNINNLTLDAFYRKLIFNHKNNEQVIKDLLIRNLINPIYIKELKEDQIKLFSYILINNNSNLSYEDLNYYLHINRHRPLILGNIAKHSAFKEEGLDKLLKLKKERLSINLSKSLYIKPEELEILSNGNFNPLLLKNIIHNQNFKDSDLDKLDKIILEMNNCSNISIKSGLENLLKEIKDEKELRKIQQIEFDKNPFFDKFIDIEMKNITLYRLLDLSRNLKNSEKIKIITEYDKYLNIKSSGLKSLIMTDIPLKRINEYIKSLNEIENIKKSIDIYLSKSIEKDIPDNVLYSKEGLENEFNFI